MTTQTVEQHPAVSEFKPLETMPADVPATKKRRWTRLASEAPHSYRAAAELMCLSCTSWQRVEVKRCAITACPLWAVSCRIFGRESLA